MSFQFRDKDITRDSVKCLAQVQVDDVSCLPFVHQRCKPITKLDTKLVRHDLPMLKPCWLSSVTSLLSKCLSMFLRRICSIILPGTEVRLTGLQFPGSSFFPFLKMGVMFPLLQAVGTSPDYQDLSNMMEIVLTTSSASK